jgi:UDP-2-acetamido-3-amino-2,3-dideoxy-glucuronate N-acetyltransferase
LKKETADMTAATAVIGTGYWGKNLLRNLDALGALAAFCDADADAVGRFAGEYPHAKACTDLSAVLGDPAIDAVAIATPAATHAELARKALEHGKHVFVEKPLALEPGPAQAVCRLAQEKGLILMVGHLLLYHPAFIALRAAVEEGKIGPLRYIHATRASFGKIRQEENALWSFAPHDISMMLALTGRLPGRVTCNGAAWLNPEVADTTLSHLDFGGGVQGHIFVSWLHPYKDHRLVVIGEKGMLVFNDTVAGAEKLVFYPHSVSWQDDLPVPNKAEAESLPYDMDKEPLRNECQHFLDCIAAGTQPRSDGAEGLRVLQVLDACQRALAAGAACDVA